MHSLNNASQIILGSFTQYIIEIEPKMLQNELTVGFTAYWFGYCIKSSKIITQYFMTCNVKLKSMLFWSI